MKFSVDKCYDCGLDLTTAEPAEVTYPGNDMALGTCPKCGRSYFMTDVTPPPPEPVVEPEPAPEPAPEPVTEPESEE